jgi:hypothetical protein
VGFSFTSWARLTKLEDGTSITPVLVQEWCEEIDELRAVIEAPH